MAVTSPYRGAYRTNLEDPDNSVILDADSLDNSEDSGWKKRYGDLRSHNNNLTKKVRELETQLQTALRKEKILPSTPQEIEAFARQYPEVFRAMQTVSMTTLKEESQVIKQETDAIKSELSDLRMQKGLELILSKHPDFNEVDGSEDFKEWAGSQPQEIQDWLFVSDDPYLCIRGLDLYKADLAARNNVSPRRGRPPKDAANSVTPRSDSPTLTDTGGKRIWKTSEIAKLSTKEFDKYEADIDRAREEGRILVDR